MRPKESTSSATLPPPLGGWNTRDPLDAMPENDAVEMLNFIPRSTSVEVRAGYSEHVASLAPSRVDLLEELVPETGVPKLIAGCGGKLFDVTASNLGIDTLGPFATPFFDDFITNANVFGDFLSAALVDDSLDFDNRLARVQYDLTWIAFKFYDRTGDPKWLTTAQRANIIYRDEYCDPAFAASSFPAGFLQFPHGLFEDYVRNSSTASLATLQKLSLDGAFTRDSVALSATVDALLSREVAYGISTYILHEKTGAARRTKLEDFVSQAIDHIDQWVVSETADYVRPFMVALTCDALIEWYNFGASTAQKATILTAITNAANYMWAECWVALSNAFTYTDRDLGAISHPDADADDQNPVPDLNLLIAPVYGWLYSKTADEDWATKTLSILEGGLAVYDEYNSWSSGAFLGAKSVLGVNGKHYNQNYRYFFETIDYLATVHTSASADPVAVELATGLTSNLWQSVQFRGRLFMVNGVDAPRDWTGTTLSSTAWTGPTSINSFAHVNAYRSRLYFVQKDTAIVWYANAVNNIQGATTPFDLGSLLQKGGHLLFMATWTLGSGENDEHQAVFVGSGGDVLVYQGAAPSEENWGLVRRFTIPKPVSRRGWASIGGDLLVITEVGLVSLSTVLQQQTEGLEASLTSKITPTMKEYAGSLVTSNDPIWNVTLFSRERLLIVSVPQEIGTSKEVILSLETGALALWSNLRSGAMAEHKRALFFGTDDGRIMRYGDRFTDAGQPVPFSLKTAFSYFGDRGTKKRYNAILPRISFEGEAFVSYGIDTDLKAEPPPYDALFRANVTPWNSPWNSPWSEPGSSNDQWFCVSGVGRSMSMSVQGQLNAGSLSLENVQVLYELGGVM